VAADMDSDGHLNETEFRYFYAPEDYLHMKPAVSRGILNRYDTDNNGYISFQEYVGEGRSEWWMYIIILFNYRRIRYI